MPKSLSQNRALTSNPGVDHRFPHSHIYIYVYMYIYICVCVYIYIYICMYKKYMDVYTYTIHMYIYICDICGYIMVYISIHWKLCVARVVQQSAHGPEEFCVLKKPRISFLCSHEHDSQTSGWVAYQQLCKKKQQTRWPWACFVGARWHMFSQAEFVLKHIE